MGRIRIDDLQPRDELTDEQLGGVVGGAYSFTSYSFSAYDAWVPESSLTFSAYDAWVPESSLTDLKSYDAWVP